MNKTNQYLDLAQEWLIDNVKEEGDFIYRYSPSNGKYSTSNNMIRQLMASRLLAELSLENTSLQTLHKKNLDYVFEHWYREENDTGYIYFENKSKLGANAMALRTFVYSPHFRNYCCIY